MNPEQIKQLLDLIEKLTKRVDSLELENKKLRNEATIPLDIDRAWRARLGFNDLIQTTNLASYLPTNFLDAPLGSITAPAGGVTQDSQARTAINTIITRLESLGLVDPN